MSFGESVTRLRGVASGTDDYGNPTYVDEEVEITGAAFAPERASSEPVEVGRVPVIEKPTLYFPGTYPDMTEHDRVRVRGDVYEVEGVPADWQSPWGSSLGGLVVTLKRVDG